MIIVIGAMSGCPTWKLSDRLKVEGDITLAIITVNQLLIQGNKLIYDYSVSDDIKMFFKPGISFYVEYEEDISDVPYGILIIPFLTNVLPISWLTDAYIYVDSIDRNFYESIPRFKQGFINMYPKVTFLGSLTAKRIDDCGYEPSGGFAAFFSGGVDSYCTLIRNIGKKPDLISIWGSDIRLDDFYGWKRVKDATLEAAETFGLNASFIKSCFRVFLDYTALDNAFSGILNNGWWGGIQHGIGMIGHAAPYAWKHHIAVIYIAATLSYIDKNVQWGSYPTIDGQVKFGSCDVCHESFNYTRQDKIDEIARFSENTGLPVKLRVCWESAGGGNCCTCEKCFRTIMGILVSGRDPNDFNLATALTPETFENIKNLIIWGSKSSISFRYWDPIKQAAKKNRKQLKKLWFYRYIKWIYSIEFSNIEHNVFRTRYERITGIKVRIKNFFQK